ncbi:sarcosine oxidase subunit alpha [Xaviernesmea oryzae]|uniref:Sarcosine oxidase subunit alpha n=1 Tax=Xaviernesmea oryzae TaxID=464029 RepID=A0A1Q9B2W9_9HYPH|nr:sarcosine oxidase subunit alpha family protein [Xaviernesmea oryzae]OLP62364.1 sarcosine oxidase subunit alpha [Xaviernesmea oryzae]SEL98252.1 sarcosine oxidase subunit alpha [Xaviernesmea oryzae]
MSAYRLTSGGLIDRGAPLNFTFDKAGLSGFAGDTLASAMLANDQLLMGRSFKYHRPRGVFTSGSAEPNALVTTGSGTRREPNARATMVELHEGLTAISQNRWPSLKHDLGAINNLMSPLFSAGFYYKTFMWPSAFWEKLYEPVIRRAAGLGRTTLKRDPDTYEKVWHFCDLLVIGAGPTGLMAALTAGRAGLRVVLADEDFRLGGSFLCETQMLDGRPASVFAQDLLEELSALPNVTLLPRTTVFGWYDDNVFGAVERVQKHVAIPLDKLPVERLWRIVAKRALLATGAEERPLVFGGNDRPGVMMASAAVAYAARFGVAVGRRVAVVTASDSGWHSAAALARCGVQVSTLIDARPGAVAPPGLVLPEGMRQLAGAQVVDTLGRLRVEGLVIERAGYEERIDCDAVAIAGGFNPRVHLACQRGAKPSWSEPLQAFLPPDVGPAFQAAGAAAGVWTLSDCLRDGAEKALALADELGRRASLPDLPVVDDEASDSTPAAPVWLMPGARSKAFVDFQNDVHAGDLALALREGFGHVEHAKRYTTNAMATDQGKLSGVNASGLLAAMKGLSPDKVGITTYRPFYTPVSFGALAGAGRDEEAVAHRHSPLHGWAKSEGAVFVEAGLWHRPAYFARPGENGWRASVEREVTTVRQAVGLCDVSTLGKIELFGPDAAEFLNRLYCNPMLKLPVGKARYGLMLREDGMVFDDGTVSRLGHQHYLITTTTGMAAKVMSHMEHAAQVLWPFLNVRFVSVTEQWAQMSLAGPKARAVLQAVVEDDIGRAAVPPLAAQTVRLRSGVKGRLFRISFSGELAYELAVPAGHGPAVARALMAAGQPHGITAYGLEALNVLRIEKGHVTHSELDGRTTPDDVGLGRMLSQQKADFIGKRMSERYGLTAADRAQLVGLVPVDRSRTMRAGAHLLREGAKPSTLNDQGHVTSACVSPTLGHAIALALLKSGRERLGERVIVWDKLHNEEVLAEVVSPVFVDPDNSRIDPEDLA